MSSTPSMLTGALVSVKVRWRKLAGTEDSLKHPKDSTEDRPVQRLRVDSGIEAFWENAPNTWAAIKCF